MGKKKAKLKKKKPIKVERGSIVEFEGATYRVGFVENGWAPERLILYFEGV